MTDIKTLHVTLDQDRSYPIHIGSGLLSQADFFRSHIGQGGKVFIITDTQVGPLYADNLSASLGGDVKIHMVAAGEASKSYDIFRDCCEWLLEHGINRHSLIIALGGGVIGDLTGFVAASVMRGVKFIQVPTTLLAQVDSSVGGKTGINSSFGKNLVGAFNQPAAVIIDIDTLKTLPVREMRAGYAEIVKYGLLGDADFFHWLEENGSSILSGERDAIITAIHKSCAMKADIVRQDEFEETGLRALLNLGHTFAHALETACRYDGRLLHGEAVGIGLVLAARLSVSAGYIPSTDVDRIQKHLKNMGMMSDARDIVPSVPADAEGLLGFMRKDKKATAQGINFVVLKKIGAAALDGNIADDAVINILKETL